MKIDGHTRVAGIFGDPIGHTLSPAMHNAAFKAIGLNAVYIPFHVKADSKGALKAAVEAVAAMNMLGVNVTIPHKERVFKFLDEADEHAIDIGAVNTIVNRDGRLFGYNTDGAGYLLSLRKETGFRPAPQARGSSSSAREERQGAYSIPYWGFSPHPLCWRTGPSRGPIPWQTSLRVNFQYRLRRRPWSPGSWKRPSPQPTSS